MKRSVSCLALLIAVAIGGCTEQRAFEDRSDEVNIRHRIPSK